MALCPYCKENGTDTFFLAIEKSLFIDVYLFLPLNGFVSLSNQILLALFLLFFGLLGE